MKFPTFRSVTSSLSTILIGILLVTVHAAPVSYPITLIAMDAEIYIPPVYQPPQVSKRIGDSVNVKKAAFCRWLANSTYCL